MLKLLSILWNSFRMALQELKVNKLRTFLSLFGITIGIFCIIGVLATVDSLENKVQTDIKALGSNTIYIDKWNYAGGNDYPWWKYLKRPNMKVEELRFVKEKSQLALAAAFFVSNSVNLSHEDNILNNVNFYGVTNEFNQIQTIDMGQGRYLNEADFQRGSAVTIIGTKVAEELFGKAEMALGKEVSYSGRRLYIVGVIKKQGSSLIGGFNYDECAIVPYRYFASIYNPDNNNPYIMVQGKPGVASTALADELNGVMRQIRKLSPQQEDNFTCNDVAEFSTQVNGFFGQVSAGGWAIAGLSLIVGAFGVANIMFVTVRERTSQIGLKKAIGAKRRTIMTEFLLESAFLCIIGGFVGLALVWLLAVGLSAALPFPIIIAPNIVMLALSICIVLGVLAGIIPASIAAKMDPVVAIRTK
ncbi:MAG: FtsX-like permease family protein [Sphingobacteriia bacterium]|nr:MAG: FtsX-like permease family protein [Sphingobacteriia bacterium]